jgi:hypothetical protein
MKNLITLSTALVLFFTFLSLSAVAQPVNDNCSGATAVTHATAPTWTTVNTTMATQSMPACSTNSHSDDDVWYSFIATDTVVYLKFRNTDYIGGTPDNVGFELFSGSCGNLTSVLCSHERNPTIFYPKRTTGIVPGQTYYIRVFSNAQSVAMTFDFCVLTHQVYDRCATAPSLIMSQDTVIDSLSFASTLYTVTSDNPWVDYPCFTTGGIDDMWFRFTASDTAQTIWMQTTDYPCPGCSPYTFMYGVYGGTCNMLDTLVPGIGNWGCPAFTVDSAHYINVGGLVSGNDYFLRLWSPKTSGSPIDIYIGIGPSGSTGQMPPPLSISNTVSKSNELILTPNPTTTQLNIRMEAAAGDGIINIVDITGKELYQHAFKVDLSLDVSDYAPGLYFIRYSCSEGVTTAKFIKQ